MIRVAIAAFNPQESALVRRAARNVSRRLPDAMRVTVFQGIRDLEAEVFAGQLFDVWLLSMAMDGQARCTYMARRMAERSKNKAALILVSDTEPTANTVIGLHITDYLIIPLNENRLVRSFRRAYKQIGKTPDVFTYYWNTVPTHIKISNIYYFESQLRLVTIHTKNGVHKFYGKLNEVEEQLRGHDFIRIQKSIMVNMRHIDLEATGMSGRFLLLDGTNMEITRRYLKDVRQAIGEYIRHGGKE